MSALWQAVLLLEHAVLSGRYTLYVLIAPALLASGVAFNTKLKALDCSWLEWSPFHARSNVMLVPVRWRWVWAPYALALAFVMPFLALFEEWLFRAGTTNWARGLLWGAIAFGAMHLLSLVSVRMAIYLMLLGALFVQVYMMGGLAAVFVLHAVYNLTALAMVVATRKRELAT